MSWLKSFEDIYIRFVSKGYIIHRQVHPTFGDIDKIFCWWGKGILSMWGLT